MYNARYVSDNGRNFSLGPSNCVFDIVGIGGVAVNLGKSQNFSQIGEFVTNQSVGGTTLTIKGVAYGDNMTQVKDAIRRAFAPMTSGTLYFEEKYFINVFVKTTPTFSPLKNDGRFTVALYAPFPFFKKKESKYYVSTGTTKLFKFPVNYASTHVFGQTYYNNSVALANEGDTVAPFKLTIKVIPETDNVAFGNIAINSASGKLLKFDDITLNKDQQIIMFRDNNGILRCYCGTSDAMYNVIGSISDNSTLFDLEPNSDIFYISAINTAGAGHIAFEIEFNETVGAVYES